jgi:hypothetical protein
MLGHTNFMSGRHSVMILGWGQTLLDPWIQERLRGIGYPGKRCQAQATTSQSCPESARLYIRKPQFVSILPSYPGIMRTINFFAYNLFLPHITRNSFSTQNVNYISYLSSNQCSVSLCFLCMIFTVSLTFLFSSQD